MHSHSTSTFTSALQHIFFTNKSNKRCSTAAAGAVNSTESVAIYDTREISTEWDCRSSAAAAAAAVLAVCLFQQRFIIPLNDLVLFVNKVVTVQQ